MWVQVTPASTSTIPHESSAPVGEDSFPHRSTVNATILLPCASTTVWQGCLKNGTSHARASMVRSK